MFTGIITAIGEVRHMSGGRFEIASSYDPATIALGASIACDGVCLTVTSVAADPAAKKDAADPAAKKAFANPAAKKAPADPAASDTPAEHAGSVFSVDVSNETLSKTSLGEWRQGRKINLERALAAMDELGGHIVTGHVDGLATIIDIRPDGTSRRYTFEVPEHLARYVAPKGSVALDGTSLTVNEVMGDRFGVNVIPHTLTATTWERKKPGDQINLEVDLIARYVARLMEFRR